MINKLKKLSPEFRKILKISSEIADQLEYQIYLVGGVVRDLLLNKAVFDLDIVVEGEAIIFVQKLAVYLKEKFAKHHAFGTATVYFNLHKIDFATARTEKYYHWGALPKVSSATLAQDLLRRDFTVNAMAISLNRPDYGRLIDLSGGLTDLKKGLIRVLHEKSFLEDPTRILRTVRFEQRFKFKIEANTFNLMKEALSLEALKFVNPHRLRDEIMLILKEPKPYQYLRRIAKLIGFSFINKKIKLKSKDLRLFLRIEQAITDYQKRYQKHRKLDAGIIYLAGLLIKLPERDIAEILHSFGFKKGQRLIVNSIKSGINKIKKLDKNLDAGRVYHILNGYSFESIVFFYAYYSKRNIRKNIDNFLNKLVNTQLKIKGEDLKKLQLKPHTLYGRIFRKLLSAKINKGLLSKKDELKEAILIFKKLVPKIKERKS